MSIREQQEVKEKYYNEAIRYMNNAKETLKKAGKEDDFYNDDKYVKTACGTAYNGVLKALDGYFMLIGADKKKGRKSIEYYQANTGKKDKKLLKYLNNAYEVLHLSGYYDGVTDVKIVSRGFELAYLIINKIKP
ncbi:MAG: DUF5618 family protein [Bacteroidales bacterium]